jgi:replication initiation protein RepC
LSLVLRACPDVADYARSGVASWRDLIAAASVARAALGVSSNAFQAAVAAVGDIDAAIAVAAILQRGDAIRSPGGYLRELTRKAEAGQFSIGPMLMALVAARNREKHCA